MRILWKRVVGWVKWRWTLPTEYFRLQKSKEEQSIWWAKRCNKAEMRVSTLCDELEAANARPNWRTQFEDAAARNRDLERQLDEALVRCKLLEDGRTASGLTVGEVERLALLAMAAGKLAAEAGKVMLYGWCSRAPQSGRPAYADVERSMGRVEAIVELMEAAGDVRGGDVFAHMGKAKQRLREQVNRQ